MALLLIPDADPQFNENPRHIAPRGVQLILGWDFGVWGSTLDWRLEIRTDSSPRS